MTTEMITLKLEKNFLKEIDESVKKHNYQSRTEFIRNSLRKNLDEGKLKEAMLSIAHLKGASKRKITEEEYEYARIHAFEKLEAKFK